MEGWDGSIPCCRAIAGYWKDPIETEVGDNDVFVWRVALSADWGVAESRGPADGCSADDAAGDGGDFADVAEPAGGTLFTCDKRLCAGLCVRSMRSAV